MEDGLMGKAMSDHRHRLGRATLVSVVFSR
jgi:hypothetical protein